MNEQQEGGTAKKPLVRYRDSTEPKECPYGQTERVVTGGEGGVANVHVITVTEGRMHVHKKYDEVYFVLSGKGSMSLQGENHPLRPGAVAVTPAGTPHGLVADPGERLEFVIFGTPPISIDDPRAKPVKPEGIEME